MVFYALAPRLRDERQRQAAVDRHSSAFFGSPLTRSIVERAAALFGTPMAIATIIDRDRLIVAAGHGLDVQQADRDTSFCGHAIAKPEQVMCVFDAAHDPRFSGNPAVRGDPRVRFYIGAPLIAPTGEALGALCAIDTVPRARLGAGQSDELKALAQSLVKALCTAPAGQAAV